MKQNKDNVNYLVWSGN